MAKKKGSITFRPRADLRERLERLARHDDRTKTQIIEWCVEAHLPVLEEKYGIKTTYPRHHDQDCFVEDRPKRRGAA